MILIDLYVIVLNIVDIYIIGFFFGKIVKSLYVLGLIDF